MAQVNWQKKYWGASLWVWLALFLFYFFFALAYQTTIHLTSQGTSGWGPNILIDYLLKAGLTLPLWWLIFHKLKYWPLDKKLWIHLVGLPLWTITWQHSYYFISDTFQLGRLRGPGSWWDIYIPGLFYILQFGIFHVYDFYVRLKEQYNLEENLRHAALKSELSALKAQLNPHFLYNIFNTINASVPAEQEKTREMIAALSDLFRYQLQGSRVEKVTVDDELRFVKKFLELEKTRFEDRLELIFDVDPGVQDVQIPPMILQPIVENALKHGIGPKIEGGRISISVHKRNDMLVMSVCDTGVGFSKKEKGDWGVGLSNTAERLEKIYGVKLQIKSDPETGTCVGFEIPLH